MANQDELAFDLSALEGLLEDTHFAELKRILQAETFFDVLRITWNEMIHSKALAWLLDPSQGHGMGEKFLREFLRTSAKMAQMKGIAYGTLQGDVLTPLDAELLHLGDVSVETEYIMPDQRRPDIVLFSDKERWLCVVENKIWASETGEQTKDYFAEALEKFPINGYPKRLFVYLTPYGSRPSCLAFVPVTYTDVVGIMKNKIGFDELSSMGRTFAQEYCKMVQNKVIQEKEIRQLCWRIYRKYKKVIDAITDYSKLSPLAVEIRDRLLEHLRSGEEEWEYSKGKNWVALWPSDWPTKKGAYFAYYEVFCVDLTGSDYLDGVDIYLGFGMEKKRMIEEFGGDPQKLTRKKFRLKPGEDLSKKAELAVKETLEIINSTRAKVKATMAKVKPSS